MRTTLNLSVLLVLALLSFAFFSCASTKKSEEKPYASEEQKQQQDLNDIESLLGITSDQPQQQEAAQQSNEGEKLKLLDTGEINQQQSNSSATMAAAQQSEQESEKYKKEVGQLKRQLKEKDQTIAQLNRQLDEKDAELAQKKSAPSTAAAFPVGTLSDEEYKSTYDEGRAAFEARQYKQAIQYFESLLASSTINPLADNAQYWIGECHYALRQYDAAIIDFEKVLTFPRSNKKADAQFKLGLCYLRKGQKDRAVEEFTRLQEDFPNSPYVARAQAILAKY